MDKEFINHIYILLDQKTKLNDRSIDILKIEISEAIPEEEISILKTERKVASLMFNKGELRDRFFTDSINIDILFSDLDVEYLKNRVQNTSNFHLKIYYLIVIWNKTRKNDYSQNAFDLIIEYYTNSVDDEQASFNEKNECLLICKKISENTKYRIATYLEAISILKTKIKNVYNFNDFINQCENNKLIKPQILSNLISDFEKYIEFDVQYYFPNKTFFNELIPLFQKCRISSKRIYHLLAINEDQLINYRKENDFIKLDSLRKKSEYLRLSGDKDGSERCLEYLTKVKFEANTKKVKFQVNSKENKVLEIYGKIIDRDSNFISSLNSVFILEYFSKHNNNLHTITTERGEKSLFEKSIRTIVMDINHNTREKKEGEKSNFSENIGGFYSLFFIPIFEQSLYKSILNGNLNYLNFCDFLKDSWIGLKINHNNGIVNIEETWLDLLKPGLYNFFSLFELSTIHKKLETNSYILSIDSLTLKFEGILRDFIRLLGGSTIKNKGESNEEILLDEMLNHKIVLESFNEPELELFKFVFTKQGMNIRNDVAHGFYKTVDYDFRKISLIILCILRLCKHKLNNTEK